MAHGPLIESMRAAHADQVPAVYQLGIDGGQATFETTAPTWPQFDVSKLPDPPTSPSAPSWHA